MSSSKDPCSSAASSRGNWGSKLGFILAAGGSAVGLGNLWKFPYLAYSNGGGAGDQQGAGGFVLIYLLAVLVLGLPIMIAEMMLGKRTQTTPIGAFESVRPHSLWKHVGTLCVITGFLLLSYYSVIAGWTVEYTVKSVTSEFSNYDQAVSEEMVREQLWHDFVYSSEGEAALIIELGQKPESLSKALTDPKLNTLKQVVTDQEWKRLQQNEEGQAKLSELKKTLYPQKLFSEFIAHPWKQVLWAFVFLAMTVGVVIGGVSKGIERWSKILMPALFVLLIVLLGRMLMLDGAGKALSFLFRPSFEMVTASTVLNAMGQAFFSLSLGMGVLITYGSYMKKEDNLVSSSYSVVIMDTLIALIASVIIFSAIFSYNLVMKDGGTGNLFTAMPVIFMKLPGGILLCAAFYILVIFAALTSAISMLEAVVATFVDEFKWSRKKAVYIISAVTFVLGIPAALSYNLMSNVTIMGKTWIDFADFLCSNWFMPIGGLMLSLFVGFVFTKKDQREELPEAHCKWFPFPLFRVLVRYIAPVLVVVVLLGMLFGAIQ